MRLRRLNLARYGHFDDFILDFGETSKAGLDFHIIFGENEAGKSTAFNAYLDLLFGIEKHCKYNFRHSNDNLYISAIIQVNDKDIEISRIKKEKASLIGANSLPVDESILQSALHGLSRESYQKMFSLNDETIEKGGEEILASKGDFGKLLFSGTAGLTNLSEELAALQERANKIFVKQSRSCEIALLRQTLQQTENERKLLDTQSSTYDRLMKKHQAKNLSRQNTREMKKNLTSEKIELITIKEAFTPWSKLIRFEEELAQIEHLPEIPSDWTKEIKGLHQSLMIAITNQNNAQSNFDNAQEQLKELTEDPTILQLKEKITSIQRLKILLQDTRETTPQVQDNFSANESELEEIKKRLGLDNDVELTQFIVSDDVIASLDELLIKETHLTNRLNTATQEASDAKDALLRAQEEAKNTAFPNENIEVLTTLLDEYIDNDSELHLNQAQAALDKVCLDIELAFKKLVPWKGSKDDLQIHEIPSLTKINRLSEKIDFLENKLEIQKAQRLQYEQNLTLYKSNIKAFSEQFGLITDSRAVHSREVRDKAWTIHKISLNEETADIFEQALAADDKIRDGRLTASDRLAQLRIEERNFTTTEEMLNVCVVEINRIVSDIKEVKKEASILCIKAGLPENFQIEDLPKWVEHVHNVGNLLEKEQECLIKRNHAQCEYDRQKRSLLAALAVTGRKFSEEVNLKELRKIGKHCQDESTQIKTQYAFARKAVAQAEEQTQKRTKDLERVIEDFKKWEENWKSALQGIWLADKNSSQVRTMIDILRRLTPLIIEQKKLNKEILAKEKVVLDFHKSVGDLLHCLEEEKQNDLEMQFSLIQKRLEVAQEKDSKRATIRENQERYEIQLNTNNSEIFRIENRIKQMAMIFTTCEVPSTLDELTVLIGQSDRKQELKEIVSENELYLKDRLKVKTRNEIEDVIRTRDFLDIDTRLTVIDADLEEIDTELEKLTEECHDAKREIEEIGSDASVAFLNEKYESILLDISNKANQALLLHLGLMAANHALVSYRERHRSKLLKETADAFKSITCGEFLSLTTQQARSEEKLIAIRTQGGSIATNDMSKGTRFQLYLALRLAGYRQFCGLNGPLPFIGDDIMETFDDGRAESTIRQLSEIAKEGQVIYFTHHRHLCEIAKNVCGNNVTIHEIPKRRSH